MWFPWLLCLHSLWATKDAPFRLFPPSLSPSPPPPPSPSPSPSTSSSCPENRTMSFPVLRQGSILHGEDNRTDLTCQTFGDQHVVMITQTGRVGTLIQVGVKIS